MCKQIFLFYDASGSLLSKNKRKRIPISKVKGKAPLLTVRSGRGGDCDPELCSPLSSPHKWSRTSKIDGHPNSIQ